MLVGQLAACIDGLPQALQQLPLCAPVLRLRERRGRRVRPLPARVVRRPHRHADADVLHLQGTLQRHEHALTALVLGGLCTVGARNALG